jgi:hypothetical protein
MAAETDGEGVMDGQSVVETLALGHLADIAGLSERLSGRLSLTAFEARVAALELEYMAKCQTREFRARFPAHSAPIYILRWKPMRSEENFKENAIPETPRLRWIAMRAHCDCADVKLALTRVTRIHLLRDLMGVEGSIPIQNERNSYRLSSVS